MVKTEPPHKVVQVMIMIMQFVDIFAVFVQKPHCLYLRYRGFYRSSTNFIVYYYVFVKYCNEKYVDCHTNRTLSQLIII